MDKKNIEKFKKDYDKISDKYGLDFVARSGCENRLLRLIISLFGSHAKISSKIFLRPSSNENNLMDRIMENINKKYDLVPKSQSKKKK